MKAIEQYFHVAIMLYKVVLTFKSVDENPVCDHSNESHLEVFSCGTVYAFFPNAVSWQPQKVEDSYCRIHYAKFLT